MTHQLITVRAGDVIGLHAAQFNPLAWTSVPCGADFRQRYRHASPFLAGTTPAAPVAVGSGGLEIGRTLAFRSADDEPHPCRHYSVTAIFGELRSILSAFLKSELFDIAYTVYVNTQPMLLGASDLLATRGAI